MSLACPVTTGVAGELKATKYKLVDQKEFSEPYDLPFVVDYKNDDTAPKLVAFNTLDEKTIGKQGTIKGIDLRPADLENWVSPQTRQMGTGAKVGLTILGLAALAGLIFGIVFFANAKDLSS